MSPSGAERRGVRLPGRGIRSLQRIVLSDRDIATTDGRGNKLLSDNVSYVYSYRGEVSSDAGEAEAMQRQATGGQWRREFEELTSPHLGALYRFAVQRLRDTHQAEDLVQEVCLKAYRAFDRFERGTDYKAWLFRILFNTLRDLQRKAARESMDASLNTEHFRMDPSVEAERRRSDPEQQLMAAALAQEVQAAVDALPQEWRAVVLLSFVEGFSYREIADILGCPLGTVMSRLYRARQLLRQCLERSLHGEGDADPQGSPGQGASEIPIDLIRARVKTRFKSQEG